MSTSQELTDRLVVAAEEQDVLYVLHWIDRMKEEKCLEEAMNGKHSWKGYSAIGSIRLSPFTQLRKMILEILLLEGANDETEDVLLFSMDHGNKKASELLINRESGGREQARDALHLSLLPLESAADWIDANLPRPPNCESLTGGRPLPLPLSPSSTPPLNKTPSTNSPKISETKPLLKDSDTILEVIDRDEKMELEEGEIYLPAKQPIVLNHTSPALRQARRLPRSRISIRLAKPSLPKCSSPSIAISPAPDQPVLDVLDSSMSTISYSAEAALPPTSLRQIPDRPLRTLLRIAQLPLHTSVAGITKILSSTAVQFQIVSCRDDVDSTTALIEIPPNQVNYCTRQLHGRQINDHTLNCSAVSQKESIQTRNCPVFPPPLLPRAPPSHPAPSTFTLLIINLPLTKTPESLAFLSNFPESISIFPISDRNQAVGFVQVRRSKEADSLKKLWNNREVDGARVKVVYGETGLQGKEAVDHYFQNGYEIARPFMRDTGKRRRYV